MKFKYFFTLIFSVLFVLNVNAQEDCDCPEPDVYTEGICLISTIDTSALWAPDECFAACWYGEDFEIIDCNDVDWGTGDEFECDCPEEDWESEGLCIEIIDPVFDTLGFDTLAFITWVPSLCFADCWYADYDYVIAECEENEWEWEDECDCPEEDLETEGFCVEIFDFEFDTTGVVLDTASFVTWVPSLCYAECWYEGSDVLLSDCDNGWEWEDECDCPEEDWESEGICIDLSNLVIDSLGYELDSLDYIAWVPSECFASCWYGDDYTIVDCPEYDNGGGYDWDLECDCEIDSDEGICILYVTPIDTLIEWVPNECYADCWGFADYQVVDCEDYWDWEDEEDNGTEIDFEDNECLTGLIDSGITLLQEFLIGLHVCEIFVLDDCVLTAPTFATDDEFIEYLTDNCPEWFGALMDESDGPSLFEQFNETQGNNTTSNENIIEALDVNLLGNPVIDQLDIQINTTESMNLNMTLSTITGTIISQENIIVNKGAQVYIVNTTVLPGGTYLMAMTTDKGIQTIKFVVAK